MPISAPTTSGVNFVEGAVAALARKVVHAFSGTLGYGLAAIVAFHEWNYINETRLAML